MLRNQLVVGLRDARLSEKLQLDADLTFAKALAQACQYEAVKEQQGVVRGESAECRCSSNEKTNL